jgi:hypothetical protein
MTALLGCGEVPVEDGAVGFREVGLWMVKQLTNLAATGAVSRRVPMIGPAVLRTE